MCMWCNPSYISSADFASRSSPRSSRETPIRDLPAEVSRKEREEEKHAKSAVRFPDEIQHRYPPAIRIHMFRSRRERTTSTVLRFYDSTKLHLKIHPAPEEHPVYRNRYEQKIQRLCKSHLTRLIIDNSFGYEWVHIPQQVAPPEPEVITASSFSINRRLPWSRDYQGP